MIVLHGLIADSHNNARHHNSNFTLRGGCARCAIGTFTVRRCVPGAGDAGHAAIRGDRSHRITGDSIRYFATICRY